jgi:hypothetical protein
LRTDRIKNSTFAGGGDDADDDNNNNNNNNNNNSLGYFHSNVFCRT